MMPNHRDVPYNTIKICLIKPLIVKANQREAQMADELKCIVFRTKYRWTTIGKQLWQKKKKIPALWNKSGST